AYHHGGHGVALVDEVQRQTSLHSHRAAHRRSNDRDTSRCAPPQTCRCRNSARSTAACQNSSSIVQIVAIVISIIMVIVGLVTMQLLAVIVLYKALGGGWHDETKPHHRA